MLNTRYGSWLIPDGRTACQRYPQFHALKCVTRNSSPSLLRRLHVNWHDLPEFGAKEAPSTDVRQANGSSNASQFLLALKFA